MSIKQGNNKTINEYDKVRLTTGEIARISEVLEDGVAYIAEIFRKNEEFSITVEQIRHDDIKSVFDVIERPISLMV